MNIKKANTILIVASVLMIIISTIGGFWMHSLAYRDPVREFFDPVLLILWYLGWIMLPVGIMLFILRRIIFYIRNMFNKSN